MEKKEKIFIVIATIIILIGIFIAFIISNSQKVPPEVMIQNVNGKKASCIIGGYEWKVFGNTIIADAIELKNADYSIDNTIVSKTGDTLTLLVTEKYTVEKVEYVSNLTNEIFETSAKSNEAGGYFTIVSPELEGTYICVFKLNFNNKGSAEYGVKVVVTDENIYDVENIISYKDTELTDILKVRELIGKLPYAKELSGIMIDNISDTSSLIIRYDNLYINIEKEDLLNNTVALFALIPNLNSVIYEIGRNEINSSKEKIYYSRDEVNNLISRNVLEYAENIELWTKEIIYEEKPSYNNYITIYRSTIETMLSKLSEKELGKYVAIDIINDHISGDLEISGDITLNEYDIKTLLRELNSEYNLVLNVDSNKFDNREGTLVKVRIVNDMSYSKKLSNEWKEINTITIEVGSEK